MSAPPRRRRLAPEVVQTSSMDCGPAALKCLLEGHGLPVSYGRLREACQTDVDGTSIDTLESVARQLGLDAEQVLIPADHVDLPAARALPAIVVVRHAETARHFVVVWARVGRWLQVMDPAVGRRWVEAGRFQDEIYRHEMSVPAADWREWAGSDAFLAPLGSRLEALGLDAVARLALVDRALADPRWFRIAALDATARLASSLVSAGGLSARGEAGRLTAALFEATVAAPDDIYAKVPAAYWSVSPDPANRPGALQSLVVRGAVLATVRGVASPRPADNDLSVELAAAVAEAPERPLRHILRVLTQDGRVAPVALAVAASVAVGALVLETLLFRGLFDIAGQLHLPAGRFVAAMSLLIFLGILLAGHIPIGLEAARLGRKLEMRLRMALMAKLPRLNDRYFHSRPITDMADRSHSIHLLRNAPALGLQLLQASLELLFTTVALLALAPEAALATLVLAAVAVGVPVLIQPLIGERDLRVRDHGAALNGFYLDALLGLAPIRAHRAEANVQRQHEHLLSEWARSMGGLLRFGLAAQAVQSTLCGLAVACLLVLHFLTVGGVGGGDLLLVYWALKLPALGNQLSGLAREIPAQQNTLMRLLEPLQAPEQPRASPRAPPVDLPPGMAIRISCGRVVAAGHEILGGVDLALAPGEHVAVVGPSGAGKSSLIGVLLGWNPLADGVLEADGAAVGPDGFETLRRQAAWVDPAVQIWNRSLAENLAYSARTDGAGRLAEAMEAARLQGIAQRLPRGLRSELGEGGGSLSGGEGQRVRFGRGLMTDDVRLALLDEPFRGLDRDQRRRLLAEARQWWRDATLLCVTHDLEETLGFPRVLVIEDGRIVEDGVPARLAATSSRYRALLDAEADVREGLWGDAAWRRLRLDAGVLCETGRAA